MNAVERMKKAMMANPEAVARARAEAAELLGLDPPPNK